MKFRCQILVLFCALIAGAGVFAALTPDRVLFTDDGAFSFALARELLGGELILSGLPSHLGGRHAGPFYLWAIALLHLLAGTQVYYTVLLLSLLKLLAGLSLILLVRKIFPGLWKTAAIPLSLSLLCGTTLWVMRVPWVNNFLLVPIVLFLFCWAVARGRGWPWVLVYSLAASIALQAHLMTGPLLAGFSIVLVGRWLLRLPARAWCGRPGLCTQALALLGIVLLWGAPAYYEYAYSGNFGEMLAAHSAPRATTVGLDASANLLLGFFIKALSAGKLFGASEWLYCVLFAAAIVVGWFWVRRNASSEIVDFLLAVFLTLFISVFAVARMDPPAHNYYLNGLLAFPPLLSALAFAAAVQILFARGQAWTLLPKATASVYLVLWLTCIPFAALRSVQFMTGHPFLEWETLEHARDVGRQISEDASGVDDIGLIVKGRGTLRRNAYYLFMQGSHIHRMQWNSHFDELSATRRRGKGTRQPSLGYYIRCPRLRPGKEMMTMLKLGRKWQKEYDVPLNCRTCSQCTVTKLTRRTAGE